jgi:hypothetical protein
MDQRLRGFRTGNLSAQIPNSIGGLRGGVALALGLTALAAAVIVSLGSGPGERMRVTLTAGRLGTTRAAVAESLVKEGASRGLDVELVETATMSESLDRVNAGTVDFALISDALRTEDHARVREVAPLYVEALHLVVKEELAAATAERLAALRGRRIGIGAPGSVTAGLATGVLAFAGLDSTEWTASGDFAGEDATASVIGPTPPIDRDAMPDAIFRLETLPSKVVLRLVHDAGYRLVALPFADAFRLAALLRGAPPDGAAGTIDQECVTNAVIPPFTYGTEPATPPASLHTLGTRLLLIGNDGAPASAVESLLDAVFHSRFARAAEPPLDQSVLSRPARFLRHPATIAYLQRDKSVLTRSNIGGLSNSLSVLGTLIASMLFLRRWWQQRAQGVREEAFGAWLQRLASIERRATELELGATLQLEPLVALQRELLQLKTEALARFAAGELGNDVTLSQLLVPLNSARDQIANLLLHLRDDIAQQAEAEGRSAQAVWVEAMSNPPEPGAPE